MRVAFFLASLMFVTTAKADEPTFCELANLRKMEFKVSTRLRNAHAYKLGKLNIIGLAVGKTDAAEIMKVSAALGKGTASDKYCVWYFNEGNREAERNFTHIYLDRPDRQAYNIYGKALANEFSKNAISFLACADRNAFIAMGCNGMEHRGPTVFGMFLAYAGCSPAKAANIVNTVWGLNGVVAQDRLAAIQAGYDQGVKEPVQQAALQAILLTK